MQNLIQLADEVWKNSIEVEFGDSPIWQNDIFLSKWFKLRFDEKRMPNAPGWYWFSVDITYNELLRIKELETFWAGGCNFNKVSNTNFELLGNDLLCKANKNELIIYNGHEKNVMNRVRSHFALNNHRTGALGINSYSLLSKKKWKMRFFTYNQIDKIKSQSNKDRIAALIQNSTGRCAVEYAWRVNHGWPILCKQ